MVDQPSGPAWGAPPPPPGVWPGFPIPFRSLRGLAVAAQILLGVAGVIALVQIPVLLNARSVAHDHATSRAFFATREVHDALDAAAGVLGLYVLVSIATAVVFIIWMWRAASNLVFFTRARPRFGPGFAIGGWFIPFANLVIPGMQTAEIWRSSPAPAGARRSTALVWWWWIAFIVGRFSILALPGGVRVGHFYRLSELDTRIVLSIAGNVVVAVSAVLAIAVVRAITARQESATPTASMPAPVDPFTAMAGAPTYGAPPYASPAAPPPAPPAPPTAYPPPPPGAHPPSSWPGPGPSDP